MWRSIQRTDSCWTERILPSSQRTRRWRTQSKLTEKCLRSLWSSETKKQKLFTETGRLMTGTGTSVLVQRVTKSFSPVLSQFLSQTPSSWACSGHLRGTWFFMSCRSCNIAFPNWLESEPTRRTAQLFSKRLQHVLKSWLVHNLVLEYLHEQKRNDD